MWMLLAGVLLLAAAGCGSPAGGRPSGSRPSVDSDAILGQIRTALAARPDVVRVDVRYSDYVTEPGAASANVTVSPGAAFDPVLDEAARLIWQSRLSPLRTIRLAAVDAADTQRGTVRNLDAGNRDRADLERAYGQRPD